MRWHEAAGGEEQQAGGCRDSSGGSSRRPGWWVVAACPVRCEVCPRQGCGSGMCVWRGSCVCDGELNERAAA